MNKREPRYFFSLPRLVQWWRGKNANRSEKNGFEANVVGACIHLVVYAFAFELCLTSRSFWQQLLWAIPLAFLVWMFWLILVYLNSLVIKALRAAGLFRGIPQSRAQGILIGVVVACFALRLINGAGWPKTIALVWIVAVTLNIIAAALLAVSRANAR